MYRDHNCGELNIKNVNEVVMLAGWVQRIRNLGSMQFVDLRDSVLIRILKWLLVKLR